MNNKNVNSGIKAARFKSLPRFLLEMKAIRHNYKFKYQITNFIMFIDSILLLFFFLLHFFSFFVSKISAHLSLF